MTMAMKDPAPTSPSRISFDPGHTTGIAFRKEGGVRFVATVYHTELDSYFLKQLHKMWYPQEAIVESVPPNNPDRITLGLFHLICEELRSTGIRVVTVMPGTWKPVRHNAKPFWSEHLRDAVDLLYYP